MNISLPKKLADWVGKQVDSGDYGTASEVVRDALREFQQKRSLREQIDQALLDALDSGEPIPATPAFWRELRSNARKRLVAKKRK